jgi:hypothetical protein
MQNRNCYFLEIFFEEIQISFARKFEFSAAKDGKFLREL